MESLGEPLPTPGTVEGLRNQRWLGEHLTEVLPDQVVQGTRWNIPRRTALPLRNAEGLCSPSAEIILIARVRGATGARELALPTAHQAPEEVIGAGIIAPRTLVVLPQSRLGRLKGGLAHNSRHGNRDPFLRWSGLTTQARPYWT